MFRYKKVLVTGGAGFIGANLVRRLIKEKAKVHVLVKKQTNRWRLEKILEKVHLHLVNLSDQKKLTKIVNELAPKYIFHLAAHGSYPRQTDISEMIQSNIVATLNLLTAANATDYCCFVYTGSSSEYGFKKKPMKETDILEPTSFYAATKAAGTLLCQAFARVYNKPIIILRPFSIYGPWETRHRLVPVAMTACLTNGEINLAAGKIRRDFVYIDDLIDAYLSACQKGEKWAGEIFNIGTGKQFTNEELIEKIEKITRKKIKINKGSYPLRAWDTDFWQADITKAKKILAWQPKHTLRTGLKKTLLWFKKNLDLYQTTMSS